MEIILLEKIQKLGEIGDTVNVKAGFARNFLVPQGKALYATDDNKIVFQEKKADIEAENLKKKKDADKFAKDFKDKEVTIIRAASESGQLYGSVSSKDIVNSLEEQKLKINKNQIILNKSIKYLTYEKISLKLHPEVIIEIILNVARSNEEANKQKQMKKAVTSLQQNEIETQNLETKDNSLDENSEKVIENRKKNKKVKTKDLINEKEEKIKEHNLDEKDKIKGLKNNENQHDQKKNKTKIDQNLNDDDVDKKEKE